MAGTAGTERRPRGQGGASLTGRSSRRAVRSGKVLIAAGFALLLAACSTVAQHLPKDQSSCNCYDDSYGSDHPLMLEHQWKY